MLAREATLQVYGIVSRWDGTPFSQINGTTIYLDRDRRWLTHERGDGRTGLPPRPKPPGVARREDGKEAPLAAAMGRGGLMDSGGLRPMEIAAGSGSAPGVSCLGVSIARAAAASCRGCGGGGGEAGRGGERGGRGDSDDEDDEDELPMMNAVCCCARWRDDVVCGYMASLCVLLASCPFLKVCLPLSLDRRDHPQPVSFVIEGWGEIDRFQSELVVNSKIRKGFFMS